jgi:hypothetical protein
MHPGQEQSLEAAAKALVTALKEIGCDAQIDAFNIHNGNSTLCMF